MKKLILNTKLRRTIGATCVILGALLMWLAADAVILGAALFAAGIVLEITGITLERRYKE
jgi:hypothetical protein